MGPATITTDTYNGPDRRGRETLMNGDDVINALAKVSSEVAVFSSKMEDLKTHFDYKLETQMELMRTQITAQIDQFANRVTVMEDSKACADKEVEEINKRIEVTNDRISKVEGRVLDLEQKPAREALSRSRQIIDGLFKVALTFVLMAVGWMLLNPAAFKQVVGTITGAHP